ncbi:EpsD family peptidyl-prolyl cis-trans isomerase [Methylophilus aquaticus]|uniref:EpsD family peptidyl-prolyl cis-trans isomerase n=1 Tax=Methylophilus aquaticus TaxID=1971610 RepID=A0ABT9JUP9_9PROT|nr:EpsD family peptidyl-prolyl cis-trans isomerase [Methylophilus aquaticus]MDP8568214.1 EpsD family peptidyl-prolyl cis-trans isomerase [Methylophilus aquaticus]
MMKKTVLIVPALLLVMAGCSKHEEGAGKGGSQVVAKVNGSEITVHQLNFALSKLGKLDASQLKPASEKILQQLVDMELLKQKSVAEKLDRDPNVLQVLEASRQQVLAQAYLQKIAAKQAAPSADEISKFYDAHPELFSERNVYVIQEFVIQDGGAHASEIEAGINPLKTADDLGKWLKEHGYTFTANASRKAAEQLPLELARRLNTLKAGDTLIVNSQSALALLFLAKVDRQPVDMDKAKLAIQQFLVNAGQQALVKNEVTSLRKEAKVEFLGDFSQMKLESAPATALPAAEKANAPAAKIDKNAPISEHDQAIQKGLSGL